MGKSECAACTVSSCTEYAIVTTNSPFRTVVGGDGFISDGVVFIVAIRRKNGIDGLHYWNVRSMLLVKVAC